MPLTKGAMVSTSSIKYMSEIWYFQRIYKLYMGGWMYISVAMNDAGTTFLQPLCPPICCCDWIIVTEIVFSYLVTTTTCILTCILSLSHNTQSNRLKFEMSILWEIVILLQIRRRRCVNTDLLSWACGPGSLASHVSHWTAEEWWCRGGAPEDQAAETPERQGTR